MHANSSQIMLPMFLLILYSMRVVNGDLLYPYGPGNGDSAADVNTATHLTTTRMFEFYGQEYQDLYICPYGMISLGEEYCTETPELFPYEGHAVIAPFWIHQDLTPGNANLWYRTTTNDSLLERAETDLAGQFVGCKPDDFSLKELVILTWEGVQKVDECAARGIDTDQCDCMFHPPEYQDLLTIDTLCCCIIQQGKSPENCEFSMWYDIIMSGTYQYTRSEPLMDEKTNTYQVVMMIGQHKQMFIALHYDNLEFTSSNFYIPYDDPFTEEVGHNEEYPYSYVAMIGFTPGDGSSFFVHALAETDEADYQYPLGTYREDLKNLVKTSNVNTPGRHMYKLSSKRAKGPQCSTLESDLKMNVGDLLYPFGPRHGDDVGPKMGPVHLPLKVKRGMRYLDNYFRFIYPTGDGGIILTNKKGVDFWTADHAFINVFALPGLSPNYYSNDDSQEHIRNSRFWYRMSSDPVTLAHARADVQVNAGARTCFEPTSVIVMTWHDVKRVDRCAEWGYTLQFCDCVFNLWLTWGFYNYPYISPTINDDLDMELCACLHDWALNNVYDVQLPWSSMSNIYYYDSESLFGTECPPESTVGRDDVLDPDNISGPSTFQAVLIAGGDTTYLSLNYLEIGYADLNYMYEGHGSTAYWQPGRKADTKVDMGYNMDGVSKLYEHPLAHDPYELVHNSNVGINGKYMYLVSGPKIEEAGTCDVWKRNRG